MELEFWIRKMATSGELIKTIANVLGLPEATLTTYYRSLREDGLVSKGGRGPSAAKMTPRDAAHMLIAAGGARAEKQAAARIVEDFEHVVAAHSARRMAIARNDNSGWLDGDWIESEGKWFFEGFELRELQRLPARHTICDALAALIEATMNGSLIRAIQQRNANTPAAYTVTVGFYGPQPCADIEFDLSAGAAFSYHEEIGYQLSQEIDKNPGNYREIDERVRLQFGSGDLEIRRTITWKTIEQVAALLKI